MDRQEHATLLAPTTDRFGGGFPHPTSLPPSRPVSRCDPPAPPSEQLIDKYRPQKPADIIGNEWGVQSLREWLQMKRNRKPGVKKAAFVVGPVGCGKTSAVYALLVHMGYVVHEFNPCSLSPDKELARKVRTVATTRSTRGEVAILIDEVDAIFQVSRICSKALSANKKDPEKKKRASEVGDLLGFIRGMGIGCPPIVFTAHAENDKDVRALANEVCHRVRWNPPRRDQLEHAVRRILGHEGAALSDEAIRVLAADCNGDIRRLMHSLQLALRGGDHRSRGLWVERYCSENKPDEVPETIFGLTEVLIYHPVGDLDLPWAETQYENDPALVREMVFHNYPKAFGTIESLSLAADALSSADAMETWPTANPGSGALVAIATHTYRDNRVAAARGGTITRDPIEFPPALREVRSIRSMAKERKRLLFRLSLGRAPVTEFSLFVSLTQNRLARCREVSEEERRQLLQDLIQRGMMGHRIEPSRSPGRVAPPLSTAAVLRAKGQHLAEALNSYRFGGGASNNWVQGGNARKRARIS